MGRILSIDYGLKRTGLAVTDILQIVPGGLATVPTHKLSEYLDIYFSKEPVDTIVVGYARNMDNSDSESMLHIHPFVGRLRKKYPDKKIEMVDERFTSVLAHRTLLQAGIHKMARRNKALVDELSATIILQSYMDSKNR
jgi:putative Holliday junction resolvase